MRQYLRDDRAKTVWYLHDQFGEIHQSSRPQFVVWQDLWSSEGPGEIRGFLFVPVLNSFFYFYKLVFISSSDQNNMTSAPFINNITIFPVKSLDRISLPKAMVTEGGCLWHDREYAIIDENGKFVNGKSNALVHTLRSNVDIENEIISFRSMHETSWRQFHLQKEKRELESYLSDYFGKKVFFEQDKTGRFMDIPDIAGVTILSTSTLKEVTSWFPEMSLEETRRRFRVTLEIDGAEAFWEDHLFSHEGRGVEFKVGDVTLVGMSPRARCVVPTRDSETGEVTHAFPKSFARHRASTLPSWSTLEEYGHHYYLTVNCYVPATEIGKWIHLGDEVRIVGEKVFY